MNTKRIVVLGLALVAASIAALLALRLMGGDTPKVEAKVRPAIAMTDVLVARVALSPGQALTPDQVRWEQWPSSAVASGFITRSQAADEAAAVKGAVVRAPLLAGQPITTTAIVHADSAGFMAAMLEPGMRAVSITITTDSGAGGFILPNDRIDLILSQKSNDNPPKVSARTILTDVRVLAVDQTFKQDKDTRTVIGKTATLELTPTQAVLVAKAQNQGALSLSLRPLADASSTAPQPTATASASHDDEGGSDSPVSVIRYGVSRPNGTNSQQKEAQ